jgi:hypothetical protein
MHPVLVSGMSVDSQLRQRLSRCVNATVDYKERYQSLKKAFGGIQDPNMKQTFTTKSSLVANDGIEILLAILRIDDSSVPKLPSGFNIWDGKGPEWRYKYVLQNYAALSLRRLCEIGNREMTSGLVRIDKIVNAGAIEALIPHLSSLECAAGYAAGILKEISCYEIYRPLVIQSHALYPLCLLLMAPVDIAKTSIRQSAECLHLLSCSCADQMISYTCPLPPGPSPSSPSATGPSGCPSVTSSLLSTALKKNDNPNLFNAEKLILFCYHHIERSVSSPSASASPASSSFAAAPPHAAPSLAVAASSSTSAVVSLSEKTDQRLECHRMECRSW